MKVWPGRSYPLGATWDGAGVNFALFSENATAAELCLFESDGGKEEVARIKMRERTDQRFNPAKLLLDPYAKAIDGTVRWSDALFGYEVGHEDADLSRDERDSAGGM